MESMESLSTCWGRFKDSGKWGAALCCLKHTTCIEIQSAVVGLAAGVVVGDPVVAGVDVVTADVIVVVMIAVDMIDVRALGGEVAAVALRPCCCPCC